VSWVVEIGDEFGTEFDSFEDDVQEEILALSRLLQQFGQGWGGPAWTRSKDRGIPT
jgi:hypothetical protein